MYLYGIIEMELLDKKNCQHEEHSTVQQEKVPMYCPSYKTMWPKACQRVLALSE